MGRNGRLLADAPHDFSPEAAALYQAELAGKTLFSAKERIVELLADAGALRGEPRKITHPVKFYEKGDKPLEIVTSRQWYIRNGGRDDDLQQALIARGRELDWHPGYMRARYEDWIEGLNGDWLISRQRYFGVPIPVWYAVGTDGEIDHDTVLVPEEDALPVDPSDDVPPGYQEAQRGQPGGFVGESDIMDTWATSSLTPQIAGGWVDDDDLFQRVFPMDLRPQGHDIIRTWLFSTMVRAHLEHGTAPWRNAALSGWILDPDRKKMSKSKGNVVTPMALLEQFGSDAVRYWAADGRPGTDTAFDEGQMKVGRRLAIKILNVSKFVLRLGEAPPPGDARIDHPVDRAMLARLATLVDQTTSAFEGYDYARALERTETFFWWFCNDHVELVKGRAYGNQGKAASASARAALEEALGVLLRLFAPILPYATEEAWSWWQEGSVHRSAWPDPTDVVMDAGDGDPLVTEVASAVLSEIRKAKTEAGASMRAEVASVSVRDSQERLAALAAAADDIRDAGKAVELLTEEDDTFSVSVTLAPPTED